MLLKDNASFYNFISNELKRILNIDFSLYLIDCKNNYILIEYKEDVMSIFEDPVIINGEISWNLSYYTNEYGLENFPMKIVSKEEIESLINADKNIRGF
jgi:hypothetical protein